MFVCVYKTLKIYFFFCIFHIEKNEELSTIEYVDIIKMYYLHLEEH